MGGDKALSEDYMQGAKGDKVCLRACVRATWGGEGEARAVPEQHGGRALRGRGGGSQLRTALAQAQCL